MSASSSGIMLSGGRTCDTIFFSWLTPILASLSATWFSSRNVCLRRHPVAASRALQSWINTLYVECSGHSSVKCHKTALIVGMAIEVVCMIAMSTNVDLSTGRDKTPTYVTFWRFPDHMWKDGSIHVTQTRPKTHEGKITHCNGGWPLDWRAGTRFKGCGESSGNVRVGFPINVIPVCLWWWILHL